MKEPIRLTNRTAISLRRAAQKTRTAHYAAAVILPLLFAMPGVYFGLKWLPAVPLTVLIAALADWAVLVHARSAYLSLIGQAICTEAAAREIHEGSSAQRRHEQAMRDLMSMREDMRSLSGKAEHQAEEEEPEDDDLYGEKPQAERQPARRRRRQSGGLQLIRSQEAK